MEFGAGKGVITWKLQQHYSNKRLILFENDNILREYFKNQFPHLLVYSDALTFPDVLASLEINQVNVLFPDSLFHCFKKRKPIN